LWIEGCGAATIQGEVVPFNVKFNAKPVMRQPFNLCPDDERQAELQTIQNQDCVSGPEVLSKRMIKIETAIEGSTEWSTAAFIVDQDYKGLLGRIVCAFGPASDALELMAYPSDDPEMASRSCSELTHHSQCDVVMSFHQRVNESFPAGLYRYYLSHQDCVSDPDDKSIFCVADDFEISFPKPEQSKVEQLRNSTQATGSRESKDCLVTDACPLSPSDPANNGNGIDQSPSCPGGMIKYGTDDRSSLVRKLLLVCCYADQKKRRNGLMSVRPEWPRSDTIQVEQEILERPSDSRTSLGPGISSSDPTSIFLRNNNPTFGAWYPDVRNIEEMMPCAVTEHSRPFWLKGEHKITYWSESVRYYDGGMKSQVFVNYVEIQGLAWSRLHSRNDHAKSARESYDYVQRR
jgi:hypothetical protein